MTIYELYHKLMACIYLTVRNSNCCKCSNCIAPLPNCIASTKVHRFLSWYSDAVWQRLLYIIDIFRALPRESRPAVEPTNTLFKMPKLRKTRFWFRNCGSITTLYLRSCNSIQTVLIRLKHSQTLWFSVFKPFGKFAKSNFITYSISRIQRALSKPFSKMEQRTKRRPRDYRSF